MSIPPFQRVLDDYATAVHRYLVAAVGPADAPDVFQETFLAALRAYPGLRRADNLRGWLFTIARNKALDHHRARNRRPVPVGAVPEGVQLDHVDVGDPVWDAVRELPERQRQAVLLRYAADLPYGEVGAVMGVTEVAARQHASTGVRALRRGGFDDSDD